MYVYNIANNSRVHTPIMSTFTHYFGKAGNFNFLLVNADLAPPELRVLYELEGTLNV